MVRRQSADAVVGRMIEGVQNNVGRYLDGVRNMDKDPIEEAIKAIPKAAQGYQAAVQSGKLERGLRASSKAEIIAGATADGGSAYVNGVVNKRPKIVRRYGEALSQTYDVTEAVEPMATDTIQQRIAKSGAYQLRRHEAAMGGSGGRRGR